MIIQENGILLPIEIKMSTSPKAIMGSEFELLDEIPDKKGEWVPSYVFLTGYFI